MKRSFAFLFLVALSIISCKKSSVQTGFNSMTAVIGSSSYTSSSVSAQVMPSSLPGKNQLVIIGNSGNKVLTLIVLDYNAAHPEGTYSINTNTAAGSYNDGTFEDVFVNGNITITSVVNGLVYGTFDLNTRTFVHIANGAFTVLL